MALFCSVKLDWCGDGLRFSGGSTEPVTPKIELDAKSTTGPSPMHALLLACAGCAGADVVSILEKMKVKLTEASIEITGDRREDHPKRYIGLRYKFRLSGEGLDRSKADRAISLSLEKYCSVALSLDKDISIDYEIELV